MIDEIRNVFENVILQELIFPHKVKELHTRCFFS